MGSSMVDRATDNKSIPSGLDGPSALATSPAVVVVDEACRLVHVSAAAVRYLCESNRVLGHNLAEVVRPEFRNAVRVLVQQAFAEDEPCMSTLLPVATEDGTQRSVCLYVAPLAREPNGERRARVLFLDFVTGALPSASTRTVVANLDQDPTLIRHIDVLERRIVSMNADHQVAHEELRAANAALHIVNEEYRTTAEALDGSREELAYTNQQLSRANRELEQRLDEVSRAHDDLENLMAATDVGTLFLNRKLAIVRSTPPAAELFDLDATDRGRFIGDVPHRLDYCGLAADAERVLATLVPVERRARSARGNSYTVSIRPYRTRDHRIEGVVVTFVDVTELSASANELRESQRQLTEELEVSQRLYGMTTRVVAATSSREALEEILRTSIDLQRADFGTVHVFDALASRLKLVAHLGFEPAELAPLDALAPDDSSWYGRVFAARTRGMLEDVSPDVASQGRHPSCYCAVHSVPLISDAGALVGVLSTQFRRQRSISERDRRALDTLARHAANLISWWRLNEQLLRQSAELREQDQRKVDFLAVLGHELRNPLAAICSVVSTLDVLTRSPSDGGGSDKAEMLGILVRQSQHMRRLVDDLLDITRINLGKLRLERRVLDARTCVMHAIQALQLRLSIDRVDIRVKQPEQPLMVNADPDRLVQVADNLLSNAVRYSEEHGRIDVSLERAGAFAELSVRDYGEGMSPAFIATLFEPSLRASEHPSVDGLGLGLAVACRLVELHSGEIEAHSEGPGRGSVFKVRLPTVDAAPEPRQPNATVRRPCCVLVVDDQADVADALGGLLRSLGHRVCVAYDARQALDIARTERPEVAILDLAMPHVSGYELANRLRAESAELRLFALSGIASAVRNDTADRAGFECILTKPPDVDLLIRSLEAR